MNESSRLPLRNFFSNLERQRIGPIFALASGVVLGSAAVYLVSNWNAIIWSLWKTLLWGGFVVAWSFLGFLSLRKHATGGAGRSEPDSGATVLLPPDPTIILDNGGRCLQANAAAVRLFGATEGQLIGHSIAAYLEPIATNESELEESRHSLRKSRLRRADGTYRVVEHHRLNGSAGHNRMIVLRDVTERETEESVLRDSQEQFTQMAACIEEIIWMLDLPSKRVLYVSPAYETITGYSCKSLYDAPTSYENLFHPEDRIRVLTRLEEATKTGLFDEEFRILRSDGSLRWVWVRGFPFKNGKGEISRLVGTAQDTTARKNAESSLASQLRITEDARAEADALRASALALTQTLSMDIILQALLDSLGKLVPYDVSDVMLLEGETRLFVAGSSKRHRAEPTADAPTPMTTIDISANPLLKRVLKTGKTEHIANTGENRQWVEHSHYGSCLTWLGVPLVAGARTIGLLSLGKSEANGFKESHIRFAELIATPAAIAIQNARLFERGEIYAAELEQRLEDLRQAQEALRESEDKYRDLVENSEDLICTHTLDGRLLSVNELPAKLLGYTREELLDKPMRDFLLPEARSQFDETLVRIARDGSVRGSMVVLTKAGERRIWEYHNTLRTDGVTSPVVRGIAHDVTEQRRIERALRLSEEKFSRAFRSSPLANAIATFVDGRLLDVNEVFEKQLGFSREEVIGHTATELGIWMDAEERRKLKVNLKDGGSVRSLRVMFRTKLRKRVIYSYSAELIELGGQLCILAVGQDITESELVRRLIAGENQVLEMIAEGKALPLNLQALCRVIEEQSEGAIGCVSLLDEEKGRLYSVAAPRLSSEFRKAIDGHPIGPDQASSGTAVFRRQKVFVSDIRIDPLWERFRQPAEIHGLRACWSAPIFCSRQKVVGTFDLYFEEPREPSEREIELVERATRIAGIAAERDRGETIFHVVGSPSP